MEESVPSCSMTVGSYVVKTLSVCVSGSRQQTPVLFFFYFFGQNKRKEVFEVGVRGVLRGGVQNQKGCMVDRLGA